MQELLSILNAEQYEAVTTTSGYIRVIAGAGSGKTRVLTHRIAYIIEQGLARPWEVMAITFTNKAAREMKERIAQLLPEGNDVWASTYHAMCARILRMHAPEIGYPQNFVVIDSDDQKAVLKKFYTDLALSAKEIKPASALAFISNCKMAFVNPEEALKTAYTPEDKHLVELYRRYDAYLNKQQVFDFDDLILKALFLLQTNESVRTKFQQRFRYIHVDEFQDTNEAQYQLVKILSSHWQNLCIVGDPDQAIYSWRGANDRLILDFDRDFPTTKTIILNQNYRSTANILDVANSLIANNPNRLAKDLLTQNDSGLKTQYHEAMNDEAEARYVCEQILTLTASGVKQDEIAILYRANYLSRLMEMNLMNRGIAYQVYGGQNFYARKEIKDALSYLRLINNLSDDIAFERVINEPKRGIGPATIAKLQLHANQYQISLMDTIHEIEAVGLTGKAKKTLMTFYETLMNLYEVQGRFTLDELLWETLEVSGYLDALREDDEEQARVENLGELRKSMRQFMEQSEDEVTLDYYLQEIALYTDQDTQNETTAKVTLMTVHAAKGLEFPYVFVIGLNERVFPSQRAIDEDPRNLEEERRLAYVAFTRAQTRLYLTSAQGRDFISNQPKTQSRFISEIDIELLEGQKKLSNYQKNITKQFYNSNKDATMVDTIEELTKGDTVIHRKFGEGTVISVEGQMANIAFSPAYGVKKLLITHPALSKKN
ncbi:MAG: ATP-dependent helicase [Culicoidibacterales bacterium]